MKYEKSKNPPAAGFAIGPTAMVSLLEQNKSLCDALASDLQGIEVRPAAG
jgi:hypothetical protein